MAFKIEKITAIVATEKDGTEGIMGFHTGQGWLPMVCADEERLRQIYPIALEVSKSTGTPFRVIQFHTREDVTEAVRRLYE